MQHKLISAILLGSGMFLSGQIMSLEYDPDVGEEINDVCAGCHGEFGQGGRDGEYPRLAGMTAEYIADQLRLFRDRKRPNMAMVEYVDDRQMPDEDIYQISKYLEAIKLNTRLPEVDETAPDFNAYARLLESKKLMQIPRAEGDVSIGKRYYRQQCKDCHGSKGYGSRKKGAPLLVGQYTSYLWRQVELFRKGLRVHDEEDTTIGILNDVPDRDLKDIFAWLSVADD